MDAATERNDQNPAITSSEFRAKRGELHSHIIFSGSWRFGSDQERSNSHSNPFSANILMKHLQLDVGKYGSVTKEIEELILRRRQLLDSLYQLNPDLTSASFDVQKQLK